MDFRILIFLSCLFTFCAAKTVSGTQPIQKGVDVDTAYTDYYNRSYSRSRYNFEECIALADSGYAAALNIEDAYGADLVFYYRGVCYNRSGQYEQALNQFDSAFTRFSTKEDTMRMADIVYQKALVHRQRTDHIPFINAINQSYDLSKAIGYRSKEGMCLNAKLIHYTERDLIDEGELIGLEALQVFESLRDSSSMGDVLNNLGNLKTRVGLLDEAIAFHKRQHELNLAVNNVWGLGYSHGKLGGIYLTKGQTQLADYHLNASLEISRQNRTPYEMVGSLNKVARLYLEKGDLQKALNLAHEGEQMAKDYGQGNPQYEILELISEIYEKKGDLKNSLLYQKEFSKVRNTTLNENIAEELSEIETKYETEKKEAEITRLSLEDQLNETKISQQRYALGGLGIGLSLLSFLLFRIFGQKKNIEEKNIIIKEALAEKNILLREIHHRVKNNLQVVSSLLGIQSREVKDQKAKDAIQEGRSRVQSMSLIHQNLYKKDNLTGIEMKPYIDKLSNHLLDTYQVDSGDITVETDIDNITLDVETVVPIGLILNELISNSLKYAFPDGRNGIISIHLQELKDQLHLSISDDGVGLNEDQLNTKEKTFGHSLIRAFKNKLEADISISSNKGTHVVLKIKSYKKVK